MPNPKLQVIERIDELVSALVAYEDRIGRAVELIVRTDGTMALMGEEETAALVPDGYEPAFEQIAEFVDIDHLAQELMEVAANGAS